MNNFKEPNKITIAAVASAVVVVGLVLFYPHSSISLNLLLDQGKKYEKIGKTSLAIQLYDDAVKRFPNSYEAHLALGNALLEADEPERAKKELDLAVELSGKSSKHCDAQISSASMLLLEGKYEQAEKALAAFEDPKPKNVSLKLGELYTRWGSVLYQDNERVDALEKYKKAFKSYDKLDLEAQQIAEDSVIKIYNELVNIYLSKKNHKKAIELLEESVAFVDNPSAHLKLALIYKDKKQKDKAIEEFEKAYEFDTTGSCSLYLSDLLVEKGIDLAQKGKMSEAKAIFEKAQEVNPSIIIPTELINTVTMSGVKTYMTANVDKTELFPELSFVVDNRGKEDVTYLKAKVVFMNEGEVLGKDEMLIISSVNPLKKGMTTKTIRLSSSNGVSDIKKKHSIQAKVYLAYDDQSDWKFARTLAFSNDSKSTSGSGNKKRSNLTPQKTPVGQVNIASSSSSNPPKKSNVAIDPPKAPQSNYVQNSMPVPQPVPVYVQPNKSGGGNPDLPPITN